MLSAIEEINALFPTSFERLQHHKEEFEERKKLLDIRLSEELRSRLVEIDFALSAMQNAVDLSTQLQEKSKILSSLLESHEPQPAIFEHVATAAHNLEKLKHFLHHFPSSACLPELVEKVKREPMFIKRAYKKLVKLVHLGGSDEFLGDGKFCELSKTIEEQMLNHMRRSLSLVEEKKFSLLVRMVEVSEMEYAAKKKVLGTESGKSMRERCMNALLDGIGEVFLPLDKNQLDKNPLDTVDHLLDVYPPRIQKLSTLFPKEYLIVETFEHHFKQRIWMILNLHFSTICKRADDKQDLAALLRAASWMEDYILDLEDYGNQDLWQTGNANGNVVALQELVNEIMECYTAVVGRNIGTAIDKMWTSDSEIKPAENSVDFFRILNIQVDIGLKIFDRSSRLFQTYFPRMLTSCIQKYQEHLCVLLKNFDFNGEQQDLYLGGQVRDEEWVCRLLNSCDQAQQYTDSLVARFGEVKLPEVTEKKTESSLEECGNKFTSIALEVVAVLTVVIIFTLKRQFSRLVTGGTDAMLNIVATVEDFASDFKEWISSRAYFERIMRKVLNLVVEEYVHRPSHASLYPFQKNWEQDKKYLHDCFLSFLPPAQVTSELKEMEKLHVL